MNVLYSIHCPSCNVLHKKLDSKNISYVLMTDRSIMQSKGFKELPMLEVDGKLYNFREAVDWINNYGA